MYIHIPLGNTRPSLYRSLTFRSQRSSNFFLFLFRLTLTFSRFFGSLPLSFFSFLELRHCSVSAYYTTFSFTLHNWYCYDTCYDTYFPSFLYFSLSLSRPSPSPLNHSYPSLLLSASSRFLLKFPQASFASDDFSYTAKFFLMFINFYYKLKCFFDT